MRHGFTKPSRTHSDAVRQVQEYDAAARPPRMRRGRAPSGDAAGAAPRSANVRDAIEARSEQSAERAGASSVGRTPEGQRKKLREDFIERVAWEV